MEDGLGRPGQGGGRAGLAGDRLRGTPGEGQGHGGQGTFVAHTPLLLP